ncbi:uncharacterized protein N7479_008155 [Penicillium vulpinum]|uniref:uncharacterized protein n=1 Tax=Penicillium vulpinum TaxID=29845 RepID=UPI0025467345|nr:uncharacterized protein N7479_008155 [Penicillium vulpinum]KAJ5961005.1 hypothetical protein N7479_008155 [Penicillium vulpinum]
MNSGSKRKTPSLVHLFETRVHKNLPRNTFPIPEIIFDLTLALSPHIFLLGMLFRIRAFKNISEDGPILDCPEKLYRLRVLDRLGQQELKLKDEILDDYVIAGARWISHRIGPKAYGWLRYRIKRGGLITGFAEVARPYCLRYSAAKAFNDSQRKQWKTQEKIVKKLQKKYKHAEEQYDRSVKQLRNEKGRQRHCLIRENLERYKNEQPVIDSERQLSEKIVNEEVKVALESTGSITPQYITLIDTVLTIPGATTEKEYKRRIAAINAVIAVCNAEEGSPSRPPTSKKRCVNYIDTSPADLIPKRQKPAASDIEDDVFSQAIASVCVKSPEERPTICFICLGNPMLPGSERLRKFKNSGSLSRHFVNKHIKPYSNSIQYECTIYGEQLSSKSALLNHAQGSHRIVSCLPLPVLGLPLPGKPSFD